MAGINNNLERELGEPFWRYIVDEHDVNDPETGKKLFTVTADDLRTAAEKGNQRIEETGDYTPIVLGHTSDDTPESEQPEIVGMGGPFEVRPLGDTGRMAIAAKFRYFKDREKEIRRKYPRCSVEVRWSNHVIDPIAVLGATTPARNLGLAYSGKRQRDQLRRYNQNEPPYTGSQSEDASNGINGLSGLGEGPNDGEVTTEHGAETLAFIQQTAWGRLLQQMMDEWQANRAKQSAPLPATNEGGIPGIDESEPELPMTRDPKMAGQQQASAFGGSSGQQQAGAASGSAPQQQRMDAGTMASSPSASNVSPAGPMGGEGDREKWLMSARHYHDMARMAMDAGELDHFDHCTSQAKKHMKRYAEGTSGMADSKGEGTSGAAGSKSSSEGTSSEPGDGDADARSMAPAEKLRMQMDQQSIRIRQYEERDKQREEEVRSLKLRYQRSERERDLIQLEAEGVLFDRAEELDLVTALSDDDYAKHVARMKIRYSRAPIGGPFVPTASDARRQAVSRTPSISGDRELSRRAINLATERNISFEQAMGELSSGTNGKAV